MRKSWPFVLAVVAVGGLAGVAIAGRPVPSDPFVLDPSITLPIAGSSPTTLPPVVTTAHPAPTTTTNASTTSLPQATTTVAIAASTSTIAGTTKTVPATTTTFGGPLPRDQVRLVLANGDGRFRLASVTADRIASLGYLIDRGDAIKPVPATIIYFRPGFDDEAEIVAVDIGVPGAIIAALPTNTSQPVTNSDAQGDVIAVLGPDAPR